MKPLVASVSVVLLGKFPPGAFSIQSLIAHSAIGNSDASGAAYETLVRDQAVDIALPWGRFACVADRLLIDVSQVPYIRGADLALKAVREIAGTAVVTKFGINVKAQYRFQSSTDRDALGARLVPPGNWGRWGDEIARSFAVPPTDPAHGGLMKVTLRQGRPENREAGWLDASFEPGSSGPDGFDVVATTNDHFELSETSNKSDKGSELVGTAKLLAQLESEFDTSVARSMQILDDIIGG